MSGGKSKHQKKKTYSESEMRRAIKNASDQAVKRAFLLCVVAAKDEFKLNETGMVKFMGTMQRYLNYQKDGLISFEDASKTLKESTGIDIKITKWGKKN